MVKALLVSTLLDRSLPLDYRWAIPSKLVSHLESRDS